ncbi:hypothetical protein [Aureivirga sp. CE67]|uniref:hypothetical protein n=1 Tax=Aureivirga sp. CE67 TaxID=1788983 RepID=UPI0018CB49C3|nr:hypothetical protein [Aureivirga sp. CE67]
MKKILLSATILLLTISCVKDEEKPLLTNSSEIRIDNNIFTSGPKDPFTIDNAYINNDILTITIDYGGGCGTVSYDLVTSDSYLTTDPLQKNIRLAFDDNDNCEALKELLLNFDLSKIQDENSDKIIINLENWDEPLEYNY